jgi:hypothetical protein
MPLYLILAGIIFGAGFAASHAVDKADIQRMELSIRSSNAKAADLLKTKTDEVMAATATAIKSNSDLDASHVSTINALNAQRDSFSTLGLRDPGSRARCPGTVPTGDNSGLSAGGTDTGQLSAELAGFLRRETYRADRTAELYAKCRTFALTNNCGIARTKE